MASAWGSAFGSNWGSSWGSIAASTDPIGRRRRTRFYVEPAPEPEEPIVLEARNELASLLEHQEALRANLKDSKGEELRKERADLSRRLQLLNRQIATAKQTLHAKEREALAAAALKERALKELQARLDEEEAVNVFNLVLTLYE